MNEKVVWKFIIILKCNLFPPWLFHSRILCILIFLYIIEYINYSFYLFNCCFGRRNINYMSEDPSIFKLYYDSIILYCISYFRLGEILVYIILLYGMVAWNMVLTWIFLLLIYYWKCHTCKLYHYMLHF